MKKLAAITVAIALIGTLAFLCLKVKKFSDDEHEQFQTALWRLKHLDTTFKEGVLKARFALVDNYDDFQTQERELDRVVEGLDQTPGFIRPADHTAIKQALAQYVFLSDERKKLFDRFKSKNAMLANSRRYMPMALDELAARLQENSVDRDLQDIVGGVTRLALMRLSSPDELPEGSAARLQLLDQWAVNNPQHEESMFVSSIVRHAHYIVEGNGELDTLTRQLLALPTNAGIEKLFQAYGTEVAKALRQAHQYRTFLYILGFISLAGVGYMLWALRSANRHLELRVAERTRELTGSEERFRMLSASAPIGIFLTDAAGGAIYTNPHWQNISRMSSTDALGHGWQKALHPDDAATVMATWEEAMREKREFNLEHRYSTSSGETIWVHARSAVIRTQNGEVTGHVGTIENITERKQAEVELAKAQKELLENSRMAGMAEVATSVLHNVGNVLNSVNISSTLVADTIRKSKATNLSKVVALLDEYKENLGAFLTDNPKGKQLPAYLAQLAKHLSGEQTSALTELASLQKNIEHIKDIVAMQQSFAKVSGVTEILAASDLIEDALKINSTSLLRHDIEVIKEFGPVPPLNVEKHKVLQILVNLIRNAKQACDDSGRRDKRMTVRVANGDGRVKIAIIDNGAGIPAENLIRIFNHGFTTRKEGHGFGLHSGALAAKEMGGALRVHSDGVGHGATFTLEIPLQTNGSQSD